ncbi:diguanylate cyclase [Massilia sp. TS11]|uniref:tetratricopeptide repeat-containing diguanylate cyclase n=1 Tax=Massilia sp. TS11 TaxID=2908003 RepID=UPI0035A37E78
MVAAMLAVPLLAFAQSDLASRLAELRETVRFVPDKGIVALRQIESQARTAPPQHKAEFLYQLSYAQLGLGQQADALATAEELIAFGKSGNDTVATAKGLLAKAFVTFRMNELKLSHQLAWDAERLANTAKDQDLKVLATVTAGQSYAEEGNFPLALARLQAAVALARQARVPLHLTASLVALANLYDQMKEFDKGFEALDEARQLAEEMKSPGRMATVKIAEYALSIDTNQPQRALKALLSALSLERQIGANAMIANTLVNLSDSYLKQRDYPTTINYATQAIEAAQRLNDRAIEATARINIGEAYLGMGRIADGKRSFEAGMAYYEKSGDKPELQAVLMEYGSALEHAGDMAGAVAAYHRERTISNELFEKQRQKAVLELQEKFDTEKKQRQIELLSRENQVKSAEIANRSLQQRVWWLLAIVFALASVIVGLLYRKVRQTNAALEVKNQELKLQSSRDPLTGLYNRRHFQEFMRTHVQVEKRGAGTSGEEIVGALFLLDVDHFKHVNDTYGHAAGDAVLKMIAENLRVILRETDMIVRWGGEEFLAFLPAIPRSGVEDIARRLLTGISAHTIDYQDAKISVNVSIGFAPFPLVPGQHPLPWERAVNLVDMALYLAKAHGRNRAYGVRGFANFEQTSLEHIEQDLERAWRAGFVDLSIVLGGWPEPKPVPRPAPAPLAAPAASEAGGKS